MTYRSGHIQRTPQGTYAATLWYRGERHRRRHDTIEDAKRWIDSTTASLRAATEPLTDLQIAEYHAARDMLPPGVSILDAAKHYAATVSIAAPTVQDAVNRFFEEWKSSGVRAKSVNNFRSQLARLTEGFADTSVSAVTSDAVSAYLSRLGYQGVTRDNYRRAWAQLFGWCQRMGWVNRNPLDAVMPSKRADDMLPPHLSSDAAKALLVAAWRADRGVVPYLALGLFAGLRPAETRRLDWSAVGEQIRVGPEVAKTRQQRLVAISPTLAAWIADHPTSGRVAPGAERLFLARIRAVAKTAKVTLSHDVLRHTFATMHLGAYGDAAKTANELGHQGIGVLYRHYRGVVTPEEAARFWAIRPE